MCPGLLLKALFQTLVVSVLEFSIDWKITWLQSYRETLSRKTERKGNQLKVQTSRQSSKLGYWYFIFIVKMKLHHVTKVGLELLDPRCPPASVFQVMKINVSVSGYNFSFWFICLVSSNHQPLPISILVFFIFILLSIPRSEVWHENLDHIFLTPSKYPVESYEACTESHPQRF